MHLHPCSPVWNGHFNSFMCIVRASFDHISVARMNSQQRTSQLHIYAVACICHWYSASSQAHSRGFAVTCLLVGDTLGCGLACVCVHYKIKFIDEECDPPRIETSVCFNTSRYTWSPQCAPTHAGTCSALDTGQQMQKHDQQLTQTDTYKSPQHMHRHADMMHANTCAHMRSS